MRLTKLYGHLSPTILASRLASSLLAMYRTSLREGGNPRALRLSICLIITSSLRGVSFFVLGWQSRRAGLLAY